MIRFNILQKKNWEKTMKNVYNDFIIYLLLIKIYRNKKQWNLLIVKFLQIITPMKDFSFIN